jgi:hypothetical protein
MCPMVLLVRMNVRIPAFTEIIKQEAFCILRELIGVETFSKDV